MKLHNIYTVSTTTLFQNLKSQPKPHDKPPQRRKCHKDIIPPQRQVRTHKPLALYVPVLACGFLALPSLTHTLKNLLSPHRQQGITHHVVPLLHVVFWPWLTSPTHSRIYLFPPWVAENDASHNCPFTCGLLALQAAASPIHLRIYLCHAKWEPPT